MGSPAMAAEPEPGETVVSFTFDGTFKGQEDAAVILSENGLAGTFYVNSGYLDFPAYLSVDQLRSIARNRNAGIAILKLNCAITLAEPSGR